MHKTFKTIVLGAVLALAAGAAAQEGVKQTERLVRRAEDTAKQIVETKAELQNTLETYNTLVRGGSADAKRIYNDLRKGADRCEKKREDVRKRSADMEQEAHTFFEEWTASLAGINNEDLKKRSQERLNSTRVSFGEILSAGRRASADFDIFMGSLRDQIVYLGYDLNPGAVTSLAEDAKKLNAQADTMFKSIDGVTATINKSASAIKAQ
jgi:uncharacterized protein YhaN